MHSRERRSLASAPLPDTAGAARALYLRRHLAAAAEHGAALLASLGLPRLVTPGFVPLDPQAVGDAVEAAISALDALDGDPEAEPSLGWMSLNGGAMHLGDASDAEDDREDDELPLGWSGTSQLRLTACDDGFDPLDRGEDDSEEDEGTALESHGRGFVRAGPDDAEEDDPAEDDFCSHGPSAALQAQVAYA